MKLYIRAMAYERRRILDDLYRQSDQVIEHIIKMIQFPEAYAVNHWAKEIHAYCHSVERMKGSNKYPSAKLIYKQMSGHNDILPAYIQYAHDTEPDEYFHDVPPHECLPYVEAYEKWLAQMLSQYGQVSLAQVLDELKKLGLIK